MNKQTICLFVCGVLALAAHGPTMSAMATGPRFVMIALGTAGGLTEANLSAYLLAPAGSTEFVALDAGTLLTGLQQAHRKGNLADIVVPPESSLSVEGQVLRQHIKAYLLSHAHFDHLAGLVLNSPEDTAKPILALAPTIEQLQAHVFNGTIWPNFGDEGPGMPLKKYHYVRLQPGHEQPIVGTSLTVMPFALCHAGEPSTAFLLQAHDAYALYVGDTGPDEAEHCDSLRQVWQAIAPLVRQGRLRGMFVEISYPDPRDRAHLYGHLTPGWLMQELHQLAALVNPHHPTDALRGVTVFVSHIKPTLQRAQPARSQIMQQVAALNELGLRFVFPEQGDRIVF
jgi:3',5'-cyclic-nucleotide phosphodiesterase